MARRLEKTVATAVKSAVGKLASSVGVKLGVVIIMPLGPLGLASYTPICIALEEAGLRAVKLVLEPDSDTPEVPMLLVTEPGAGGEGDEQDGGCHNECAD